MASKIDPDRPKAPTKHYYRAPYPILSFLIGLYCDNKWSSTEFEKWKSSEKDTADRKDEVYLYDGYLTPYADMPLAVARIISFDVPNNTREKTKDGRSTPDNENFDKLFAYLKKELLLAPSGSKQEFDVDDDLPLLSALGTIFLLDGKPEVTGPEGAILKKIADLKGKSDIAGPLQDLAPALKQELTSKACW